MLQSGAATCSAGFVKCFCELPCLSGNIAATTLPEQAVWNSKETFYKYFGTSCCSTTNIVISGVVAATPGHAPADDRAVDLHPRRALPCDPQDLLRGLPPAGDKL